MTNKYTLDDNFQINKSVDELDIIKNTFSIPKNIDEAYVIKPEYTQKTDYPLQYKSHTSFPVDTFKNNLPPPPILDDESKAAEATSNKSEFFKASPAEICEVIIESGYLFCYIDKILNIFDNPFNYWRPIVGKDGSAYIQRIINPAYRPIINKSLVEEVIQCLLSYYDDFPVLTKKDFNKQKGYINFKNGVYRIREATFHPNLKTPELYFRCYIDTPFQNDNYDVADNPEFYQYLQTSFNSDDDRKALGEMMGLCLSNIRDLKYLFFLYGEHNSGKSVLQNLIDGIIGTKFTEAVPYSYFCERFAMAQVYGKSVNLGSEIQDITPKKLDCLKRATGNDKLMYEYKNFDPFTGINMTLFLFACNNLPYIPPRDTDSLFSRIFILGFPKTFERKEWIYDLTELILENPQPVIHFALDGLKRFIDNNYCFTESKSCKRLSKQYKAESNSFLDFALEHIKESPKSMASSKGIREQYELYCKIEELEPLDVSIWSRILQSKYHAKVKRNTKPGCDVYNERSYKGIELMEVRHDGTE